jgi:conjugative transfer signal peptidase TraF
VAVATAVVVALLATLPRRVPLLLWNASASSPPGLYRVGLPGRVGRGDMVVAWAPAPARKLAAERRYLPFEVPLVKPVAAIAGDRVCARGTHLFVNGRSVAARRAADPSGRLLPWWTGCVRLGRGDVLLLSRNVPAAYDGRYFGITRRSEIVGKARLLWRA